MTRQAKENSSLRPQSLRTATIFFPSFLKRSPSMFQESGTSGGNSSSSSALDRKYSALVNLEDILMDDDLGPMSKCDPMLSSPDNIHTLSSGLSSSATLQLSSSSSMSSAGSSSSRCSSVDNLESLESSHHSGGAGLTNLDGGAAYVATRGRPPAAASSGRRRGPAMKRLHERNGGAERTESVRLPRAEVFMGAPPRQQRIPVVTRTSIITSTAAAAQPQPPPPPAFSMIFPLPEEISQLSDEFMPSSSENATSPAFRTLNHHHQHQLRQNDGANHSQTEASPSLSSPKQVSLEILPGACLSHHDLGGFFVTTAAATSASEMSNTETLSERCLSLDDLRTSSSVASSNCIGFQQGATMTAGSSNAVARAASTAATYSLHPLGGVQSGYVHHQLGACKKVILEERPITPHGSGHHNTDSKVYLRL
jgi:hypothetical protein